jgi:hypothetical protein
MHQASKNLVSKRGCYGSANLNAGAQKRSNEMTMFGDIDDRITASSETLMHQASMTAATYMHRGIEVIDGTFGRGYAKQHPELLGQFIMAAAIDCGTAIIAKKIQDWEPPEPPISHSCGG